MSKHGNWSVILKRARGIQKRVTEIIKRVKDCSYRERLEESGLTTLLERRMRCDRLEIFEMINGISNYGRHFFDISPQTGNLLSKQILKTKSTNWIFANKVIYFRNKLPNQIRKKKAKKKKQQQCKKTLNSISETMIEFKREFSGIRTVYRYYINSVYRYCIESVRGVMAIVIGNCGVMVTDVGNEPGDTSSNPGRDGLHFT